MTCVYVYRCSGAPSPAAAASDDSTDRYHPSCSTNGSGIADASIWTMYVLLSPPSTAAAAAAAHANKRPTTPNRRVRNVIASDAAAAAAAAATE
uniref:Uncharacterized protein n=1 Tax=Arundo donax TaxID=35708 RepID=A0A0A9E1P2_ARUDO